MKTTMSIDTSGMKRMTQRSVLKTLVMPLMMVCWGLGSAVQLNPQGTGQVLIYPFYTVNNNLNTAYSLVNTTDQAKVVKVTFRESQAGIAVLIFSVYLGAYDVWTGGLIPQDSSINGHVGEPSVRHLSGDATCAPFLNKNSQEFLPFLLDLDQDPENRSLARARTGHFEVLELGTLTGQAADLVNPDLFDQGPDCAAIEAAWSDGEWSLEPVTAPSAGLLGSAFVVNVADGVSFSYDAVALDDFWGDEVVHTSPGSELPDLSSGMTQSVRLLDDGRVLVNQWETGYEAVSAVLMNTSVINEYALDQIVDGQTEWVMNFPTRHHHVNPDLSVPVPPFNELWNGQSSCEIVDISLWDRESQEDTNDFGCGFLKISPCPPTDSRPKICASTSVISYHLPFGTPDEEFSEVLGADNLLKLTSLFSDSATENGWSEVNFISEGQLMSAPEGDGLQGLPVTGFAVQQYHNAFAGPGLLARYGSVFAHKGRLVVFDLD
jgi:hypothetical protein